MHCHRTIALTKNRAIREIAFVVSIVFASSAVANQPPAITLVGGVDIDLDYNTPFVELGYQATDAEDGDLTASVTIANGVNIDFAGTYPVYYRVTDSAGASTTVVRTVNVANPLPQTREDAARFLRRATFGPTSEDIDNLMQIGYHAWIDEQFAAPRTSQRADLLLRMRERGYPITEAYPNGAAPKLVNQLRNDAWMDTVLNKPDQLRQRVAFALSQIFVVSSRMPVLAQRPQGMARYHDILAVGALGNYRDVLDRVTRNPMMGTYLSMIRNRKADPVTGIEPDENYAREVLQLFSIGLDLLNHDGRPLVDSNGAVKPAYTQEVVENFARVFTGWNWGDARDFRAKRTLQSELIPMKAFNSFHDTGTKTLLYGQTTPAGKTAGYDLRVALDNIFYHQNVPPFISKQLIQKLVTSNPSSAYVGRVAAVFKSNQNGERGDLKATVRAILMDPEAILGHQRAPNSFGRLKEPLLKMTELWRAFDAEGFHPGTIRYTGTYTTTFQELLKAPSVFNFYSPSFSPVGEVRDARLLAPEFGVLNDASALHMHNDLYQAAYSGQGLQAFKASAKHPVLLDINYEKTLASDPVALVDHLTEKLIGRSIHPGSRYKIIYTINGISQSDGGAMRVAEAIYFLLNTNEYAVQR